MKLCFVNISLYKEENSFIFMYVFMYIVEDIFLVVRYKGFLFLVFVIVLKILMFV